MLNVTFLRHAKSEWGNFDGDDLNRDISEIGIEKTKKIGSFLRNEKIVFDEVLCSPSLRTKKTLAIVSVFFLNKPKVRYIKDLYYTSGKNLFDILMLNAQKKRCLIVSHEPLLSSSIELFFNDYNNKDFLRATEKFSTSSLFNASFECDNWYEISADIAKINFFKKPKDLNL